MRFEVGDQVRLNSLPERLDNLPTESKMVFEACLGGVFPIEEIEDDGTLVLDVSKVAAPRFGGHRHIIMVAPSDLAWA
jgi:hypothetical protein